MRLPALTSCLTILVAPAASLFAASADPNAFYLSGVTVERCVNYGLDGLPATNIDRQLWLQEPTLVDHPAGGGMINVSSNWWLPTGNPPDIAPNQTLQAHFGSCLFGAPQNYPILHASLEVIAEGDSGSTPGTSFNFGLAVNPVSCASITWDSQPSLSHLDTFSATIPSLERSYDVTSLVRQAVQQAKPLLFGIQPATTPPIDMVSYAKISIGWTIQIQFASPGWYGASSSDWAVPANWVSPASPPDAPAAPAIFGNPDSNPSVDLGDSDRTVGSLTFNDSVSTTIASAAGHSLLLDNNGATVSLALAGTHTISAPVQANDHLAVSGTGSLTLASLTLAPAQTLTLNSGATLHIASLVGSTGTLTVKAGGTLLVDSLVGPAGGLDLNAYGTLRLTPTSAPRQTPAVVLELSDIDLESHAHFDLTNHDLIVHYAPGDGPGYLAGATDVLRSGMITSSTLPPGFSLGFADNNTLTNPYTSFDGVPLPDPRQILIKYTYTGDANLDGTVTFADFQALLAGYNSASTWATGDFNQTGFTDFADFQQLLANYGNGVSSPLAPVGAGVPEPASLALLAVASVTLLHRCRRTSSPL